jgi:hypothetical protein
MDPQSRMDRAWKSLRTGRFDEALADYEWLWTHIPTDAPDFRGVRVSFLAMYIRQLCELHEPARRRFLQLRDVAAQAADSADDAADVRFDWMVLNEIIDEGEASLAWFDRTDLSRLPDQRLNRILERLAPRLIKRGRWRDIGVLQRDPLGKVARYHEIMSTGVAHTANAPEEVRTSAAADLRMHWRHQVQVLYRSLLVADRGDLAAAVCQEALRLDDSPELRSLLEDATVTGT